MARTLEEVFLQKVSQMPKEEYEVTAIMTKEQVKGKKTNAGIFQQQSLKMLPCRLLIYIKQFVHKVFHISIS